MSFVHLHNHSHYSILTGLPKPGAYVEKAKELGMPAVALTDTANIHGAHEFYKACKNLGIKPIIGTEIFIQSETEKKLKHKLVLLAKNYNGFKNIIQLTTQGSLANPGDIPFIDLELLKKYSSDIICLSGPLSGEIAFYILSGKGDQQIYDRIKFYQEIFGVEDYYLEILSHSDIPKQNLVTDKLIELHNKYGLQVVATNDTYYINKEDKRTQDVIRALGTGHEIDNPDRPTMINGDYSFLSYEEMQMLFGYIPSALENTIKISEKIDIEIETGGILIPKFELPEKVKELYEREILPLDKGGIIQQLSSDEWYLRYLCFKGLNWRYDYQLGEKVIMEFIKKLDGPKLNKPLQETSPEELKDMSQEYYTDNKRQILAKLSKDIQDKIERLEYELLVVHEMGFDGYFLIVADYIGWARDNAIPVGPGRGSAAGALLAYLSGITDIDPLDYDLLFERFLNPARVSMPDIDTDFSDEERDRVVEYCRGKYGSDHVAQICTFGTFAARAAVKDVGRVRGIPFAEMNNLVKLIPEKPGTKLKSALEDSIEFKQAYEDIPKYKDVIDDALKIEGNVRQLGVHACAVIIAPEPITNFTALQHPPKDENAIVTQYSAYPLEDLGLLKMDFLGLRNLTIIKRALEIIKNTKGDNINISKINLKDQKVFKIFANGDTTGVFQFESDGMRKYLRDLSPNSFEDLIAMVSLYRPGPLAYIPTYIERKYGREEIKYLTDDLRQILESKNYSEEEILNEKKKLEEDLKKILDVSYGIAVYQEQLMFIVQYMAGFSLGEADLLRRGIGKKKIEVIEAIKKEFITKSATFRGYKPETSRYIYEEMIQPAANYSFNKSHAACYAYIAYQTAYLKAYYPTEFLVSMMTSDEENMDRIILEVDEARSKGIEVLPPSIDESLKHFTYINDHYIRFGLKAIKGIGDGPIDKIIETREKLPTKKFKDLVEFIESTGREVINKKSLESLILSGAMDNLGGRAELLASIDNIIKYSKNKLDKKETNQMGLFDIAGEDFEDKLELKKVKSFSYEQKLIGEKEMLGFMVSGHPLDGLRKYCIKRSNNVRKLKMTLEEISKLEPELSNKPVSGSSGSNTDNGIGKRDRGEVVQAVGVIKQIKKIITKTGKVMLFLFCEGFDYDFEVTLFNNDYEKYKEKLEEYKIIIASGNLNINLEYGRKTIQARDLKIATISQVREQAKELELFDNSRVIKNIIKDDFLENADKSANQKDILEDEDDISQKNIGDCSTDLICVDMDEELFDEELDKKIKGNKIEEDGKLVGESNSDKFVIIIPTHAIKEDLYDLKDFLLTQNKGYINIYIDLKGQEIDTKISLSELDSLRTWISMRW